MGFLSSLSSSQRLVHALTWLSFFSDKYSHTRENNTADLQITMCSAHGQHLLQTVKYYKEWSTVCHKLHIHNKLQNAGSKLQLRAQLNKYKQNFYTKSELSMYKTYTTCHIEDNGTLSLTGTSSFKLNYGDRIGWLSVG